MATHRAGASMSQDSAQPGFVERLRQLGQRARAEITGQVRSEDREFVNAEIAVAVEQELHGYTDLSGEMARASESDLFASDLAEVYEAEHRLSASSTHRSRSRALPSARSPR